MRLRSVLLLALSLLAGLLVVPSHAAGYAGFVNEHAYVKTKHGEMYVQYWRPKKGKAPVLLQMSPYRYLYGSSPDADAPITDNYSDKFVPQGYAAAYADLLGTGLSGGCWNYGGRKEAEAGAAVVEWLGTRPWSNGKVGMIGTSYDGAIQLAIATLAPKHLAAIVPQEPVSSWYHYNYDGAVTHNLDDDHDDDPSGIFYPVGTPDIFDLVLGRTPNTDPDRLPGSLQTRAQECDAVEHNLRGHYVRPEYDSFWVERNWGLRARNVRAAVLMQHGWRDMNTKPDQFARYWLNLRRATPGNPGAADVRAVLGQWRHTDVLAGGSGMRDFPVSGPEYLELFLARWLKGRKSAAYDRIPRMLSQATDGKVRTSLPWTGTPRPTQYFLDHPAEGGRLLPGRVEGHTPGVFVNSGTETSATFKHALAPERGYVAYYGKALTKATRYSGRGEVFAHVASSLPRGQLVATLLDVAPDGTASVVTLGMLDLRYRSNAAVPKDMPLLKPELARVVLRSQDHVFARGHRMVLALAGSDTVWGIPDPVVGQQLTIMPSSNVILPLSPA